ncbi:MAG: HAD-IA family hydrolase [Candidatus Babeliaceae bacterium]
MILSKTRRNRLFLAIFCLIAPLLQAQPHVLWFDFGDTLARPNNFSMARNIGIKKFIGHMFIDLQNPMHIEKKTFDYLFLLQTRSIAPHTIEARTTKGRAMPPIMRDWLAGIITGEDVYKKAVSYSKLIPHYFTSNREKKLILKTIRTMFDPQLLAEVFYPVDEALELLSELSAQKDADGKPLYTLMICSNMDQLTFDCLRKTPALQNLFSYFAPENMIISGNYRNLKPEKSFFETVLKQYAIDPHDCVFIDDRKENVDSARACSIKGIHLRNKDYKAVKRQLQILKVLP